MENYMAFVPSITKKELVDRIADETGVRRVHAQLVIERFLQEILDELVNGHRIELRDFGVFSTRLRKACVGQNFHTGEPIIRPPKRYAKFKAGTLIQKRLVEFDAANPTPEYDE